MKLHMNNASHLRTPILSVNYETRSVLLADFLTHTVNYNPRRNIIKGVQRDEDGITKRVSIHLLYKNLVQSGTPNLNFIEMYKYIV